MDCPHCAHAFHPLFYKTYHLAGEEQKLAIYYNTCPECKKYIVYWKFIPADSPISRYNEQIRRDPQVEQATLIYPREKSHKPLSNDVPSDYARDFEEAYSVINLSPKASAALSRRLLQKLLRDRAGIKQGDLSKEIQEVIDSNQLPQHLSSAVDAIRNIGNFSAHPTKSQITGQIVDVEDEEAQWTLDVLEQLFDFYFVQPAETARKTAALNKKLADHGKPPMK